MSLMPQLSLSPVGCHCLAQAVGQNAARRMLDRSSHRSRRRPDPFRRLRIPIMSPSWTPRLPISWIAGTAQKQEPRECPAVRLNVVSHPQDDGPALVSPQTAEQLGLPSTSGGSARGFLHLAEGSDCVLPLAADGGMPDGQIAVTGVQGFNLHLGPGIAEEFRVFVPPPDEPFELVQLEIEVSLLGRPPDGEPVQVDAQELSREFLRRHFGQVLALSQACVLSLKGSQLLLRVTKTDTLDAAAQEERLGYHCYRGLLTHDTQVFFHTPDQLPAGGQQQQDQEQQQGQQAQQQQPEASSPNSSREGGGQPQLTLPQSMAAARGSVSLLNARPRPAAGPSSSAVSVFTSDGEWFPVNRKLLRPCIALTKAVRAGPGEDGRAPEVTVDIDTLTFDRVLIFLEALALGREPPSFGLHLCPQLLAAAQHLGLRPLEEYCRQRMGEAQSRLRFYRFEEIRALNVAGGCWLILDGMVLDVTRWLPEHPGGSRIIPEQSLNLDCSRMFECYHASRESFVYLRQFYEGEVLPEDRHLVPVPSPPPSEEFMEQLRDFTPWRLSAEGEARTHLGAKKRAAAAAAAGRAAEGAAS